MKQIGIDARLYFKTGVGVYLRNLLHYLQQNTYKDLRFNIYVLNEDAPKITFTNSAFQTVAVPYQWHTIREQTGYLQQLNRDKNNLMHFTYFGYPALYQGKFIATVHDLTPLLFKTGRASTQLPFVYEAKHALFKYVLRSQVTNAQAIITPTKTIKDQIGQIYGEQIGAKTTALYEGIDAELATSSEDARYATQYPEPFYLYVGNFYPHKNVERLVQAYARSGIGSRLLLVGPHDHFTNRVVRLIDELGQQDRISIVTDAKREDLIFLYRHAKALVHPSLSEGFGLPIVEAMHFNLPIVASDIPVFKELMGSTYTPFQPTDVESIAAVLKQFDDRPQRVDYAQLMANYSFEEMSKQTLALYNKYVSS
jgi:glycosyltransferase involved in cell wall biosynthesis